MYSNNQRNEGESHERTSTSGDLAGRGERTQKALRSESKPTEQTMSLRWWHTSGDSGLVLKPEGTKNEDEYSG